MSIFLQQTTTRVKTHKLLQVCKQVVTSLFTSCQQVPSLLWQVWNKLLTTCNKLDMALSDLLQGCSNKSDTDMI